MKLSIKQYKEIVGFNSPLYNITDYTKFNWLSNQGQIKHNLWDGDWENGAINDNTGVPYPFLLKIRSKNFIKISQSTNYYFKIPTYISGLNLYYYDKDYNFISSNVTSWTPNQTSPENARYLKFTTYGTNVTEYHNDIYIYQVIENLVTGSSGTSVDVDNFKALPNDCYSFYSKKGLGWGVYKEIVNSNFAFGDYKINYRSNYNTRMLIYNITKGINIYLQDNVSTVDEVFTLTPENYAVGNTVRFLIYNRVVDKDYLISNYYVTKIDDSLK